MSERLNKVEQVSWPSTLEEAKTSDNSKNTEIAMPPALEHHQSSSLSSGSSISQSEHSVDIDRISRDHQSSIL